MTHKAHDNQTEPAGQPTRSTAVKRVRKALSLSVSIFTPINDMRRMGSDVSQSLKTSISRLKAFRRQAREEKREKLTFEQAVQASGYSLPQLLWKYRFLKRLWWVVAGLFPGPDARSDGHDTADGVYPALNDVLAGDYFCGDLRRAGQSGSPEGRDMSVPPLATAAAPGQ